jgi:hypothetical protein
MHKDRALNKLQQPQLHHLLQISYISQTKCHHGKKKMNKENCIQSLCDFAIPQTSGRKIINQNNDLRITKRQTLEAMVAIQA